MIEKLTICNFQSHKLTEINFCDGVNAIVGLSDSGKSAVLRALTWVLTNKPTGADFMSSWATERGSKTEVVLEMSDGTIVTRGRTASDNYYFLNIKNQDVLEFRAFGQDVPEEIKQALNVNDVNIQPQLEAPFLLSASPGDVAKTLNRIVNLDVIDTAVSSIRKKKLAADHELKSEEARLSEIEEQAHNLEYLEEMEREVLDVAEIDKSLQRDKKMQSSLDSVAGKMIDLISSLQKLEKFKQMKKDVDVLDVLSEKMQSCVVLRSSLVKICDSQEKIIRRIDNIPTWDGAVPLIDEILILSEDLDVQNEKADSLDSSIEKQVKMKGYLQKIIETIDDLKGQLPDTCPLCGGEM